MKFDFDEKPHILAVDDNLIDRKVIERLFINSTCKGMKRKTKKTLSSFYLLLSFNYLLIKENFYNIFYHVSLSFFMEF